MSEIQKRIWRRWLQFRLSTWLILVGITAWATATRPLIIKDVRLVELRWDDPAPPTPGYMAFITDSGSSTYAYDDHRLNPRLAYPALALATFLAWKGFWLVQERRARRIPLS